MNEIPSTEPYAVVGFHLLDHLCNSVATKSPNYAFEIALYLYSIKTYPHSYDCVKSFTTDFRLYEFLNRAFSMDEILRLEDETFLEVYNQLKNEVAKIQKEEERVCEACDLCACKDVCNCRCQCEENELYFNQWYEDYCKS